MTSTSDVDWASHDGTRIKLSDLFHEWRTTFSELQQQRAGGAAAHRDLIGKLVSLEEQIERLLAARTPPPA